MAKRDVSLEYDAVYEKYKLSLTKENSIEYVKIPIDEEKAEEIAEKLDLELEITPF